MEKKHTLWNVMERLVGRPYKPGHTAVGVAASLALLMVACLTPANLDAQTFSPTSIVLAPSEACGGGLDRVDDVCITLPEATTCNTVDVFLLFDDTGSFEVNATKTGEIFGQIVKDLTGMFPDVDFAFGVGRFEDFGGPGTGFATATPILENRPFILNQALLEVASPTCTAAIRTALFDAGKGPGQGGDFPETAIEALNQAAKRGSRVAGGKLSATRVARH